MGNLMQGGKNVTRKGRPSDFVHVLINRRANTKCGCDVSPFHSPIMVGTGTRLSLAEGTDGFFKQIFGRSYVLLRPWPFAACIFLRALGSSGSFFVTYIVAQVVFLVAQCLMHCWCWPATEPWQQWCFMKDYQFRPCSFGARARGVLFCLLLFAAVPSPFALHCFHLQNSNFWVPSLRRQSSLNSMPFSVGLP